MGQSLTKLYVHIVFHVKRKSVLIRSEDEKELYAYIGGIIKINHSIPFKINGIENHIHILAAVSKNIAISKFVEEIKRNSSRWIKTKGDYYRCFAWQGGYGAFTVGYSLVPVVERYIENQKVHHRRVTSEAEYVKILRENDVDFNEKFLWD